MGGTSPRPTRADPYQTVPVELPARLREALDRAVAAIPPRDLAVSVKRLIARYRAGGEAGEAEASILASATDVAAYAAYRMPATYAAARACIAHVSLAAPEFAPLSLLDLGGGTGAAAWAATEAYPSIAAVTVVDQARHAIDLGLRLGAASGALRSAAWQGGRIGAAELLPADLVAISYVLGELAPPEQADVVRRAAAICDVLLIIEPDSVRLPTRDGRPDDARRRGPGDCVAVPTSGAVPDGGGRRLVSLRGPSQPDRASSAA